MNEMREGKESVLDKPEVILVDLGKVLLFSKEELPGKMNPRHKELLETKGDNYPFFEYFGINNNLLSLLSSLKDEYRLSMITEGVIQNHPPLREKLETAFDFEDIISTGALKLDKKKPEAYEHVIKQLGVDASSILFIDDSSANTKAAEKAGLRTIQCTSENQTISELRDRLDLE